MHYKTLGNTGLLVSRLCFGTMTFGGGEGVASQMENHSSRPEVIEASSK